MEKIDLGEFIEEVMFKFNQNRIGAKPTVLAKIPPDLPHIFWHDDGLEKFIKAFLYDALLMNNPEMPVRIIVHERTRLTDLEGFVGVSSLYWIQLRIEGHGPGMIQNHVEERLNELGYRCEEWVGVEGSHAQLAIFTPLEKNGPKMVFCIDVVRTMWKCDFLIPISEKLLLPSFSSPRKKP